MRAHPGRKGHPRELRQRAAAMRLEGMSRAGIARELEVGFSTVARWFREDAVPAAGVVVPHGWSEGHHGAVRERWAAQQVEQDGHRDAVGPLSERELLLVGAALYWAEGAKAKPWRRTQHVAFMNSDPTMVVAFLAYLRVLEVPRSRTSCSVSIHQDADVPAAERFWRQVVGEDVRWRRPNLKRHNPKPSRYNRDEHYRGCLRIDVMQSASEYRRIAGTWEGMALAVRGEWSPVV